MVNQTSSDYLISRGPRLNKAATGKGTDKNQKPVPLTRDGWLDETADTVGMYKQLTLFPMDEVAPTKAVQAVPEETAPVPHEKSFRFFC